MPPQVQRVVRSLSLLCLIGTGSATLAGFVGGWSWVLDLLSHFRMQYLVLLLLAGSALAVQKMWPAVALAAVFVGLNLIVVLPLYLGSPEPAATEEDALSLVVFNVNYENSKHAEIADYLVKQDADLIVVLEATEAMRAALSARLPAHSIIAEPRIDAFGLLVYSRLPFLSQGVLYLGDTALPSIELEVKKQGTRYSLLALHTMPPVSSDHSAMRNRMLADAAKWSRDKENALLVGDLNATPWSSAFHQLLEEGKLTNSQRGFGIQSSWPGGLWPLAIPIDHGLHGSALTTVDRSVGPFLGSDHRPLHLRVGSALD